MGVTQRQHGEDNVAGIVNVGLSRGFVGRENCGLMPIRGHSGVQGGAEMGAYATAFPGGVPVTEENARTLGALWGFEVPSAPGLIAPGSMVAGPRGELGSRCAAGGNLLEGLP